MCNHSSGAQTYTHHGCCLFQSCQVARPTNTRYEAFEWPHILLHIRATYIQPSRLETTVYSTPNPNRCEVARLIIHQMKDHAWNHYPLFRREERRRRKIIQRVGWYLTSPISGTDGTVITGITTFIQIQDIPVNVKCCSRSNFLSIFQSSVFNYYFFKSVTRKELPSQEEIACLGCCTPWLQGASHHGSPWPGQEPGH